MNNRIVNIAPFTSCHRRSLRTAQRQLRTKALTAALVLQLFVCNLATAGGLWLVLAPSGTSIKPHATVSLTVYLYNTGSTRIEAPSLDLLSLVYTVDDPTGKRLGRAGGDKEISTGPPKKQMLEAHAITERTVTLEVPAEPGDLVKVYAELGKKPVLRSNSILLFCPPKANTQ